MLWFIAFSCLIYSTSTNALRCVIENSIMSEPFIENCSSSTTACFWFKCDYPDAETKEKGCEDKLSTLWNCEVLRKTCTQGGGKANCDTCSGDLCNNAMSTTAVTFIATIILSILPTLSIILYV